MQVQGVYHSFHLVVSALAARLVAPGYAELNTYALHMAAIQYALGNLLLLEVVMNQRNGPIHASMSTLDLYASLVSHLRTHHRRALYAGRPSHMAMSPAPSPPAATAPPSPCLTLHTLVPTPLSPLFSCR